MAPETTTPILYVRIPPALKRQLETYKNARAETLTAAVTDLLGRGLASVANAASVEELEVKASGFEQELALTRIQLAEANAALRALSGREQELKTLGERAELPVGSCPFCHREVRGSDVLLTQRCPNPNCGRGLTSLLLGGGASSKDLDRTELLVLLGALGIIVGAAYLQSKAGK